MQRKLNIAIFAICILGVLKVLLFKEALELLYIYSLIMGVIGLINIFSKNIIEISKNDYKKLIELSKELQTQTNNSQAYPYFWEPSSYRMEMNPHGEGQDIRVYHDTELYGFLEFAECDDYENYNKFLKYKMKFEFDDDEEESEDNIRYNLNEYYPDLEEEWKDYIEDDIDDTEVYTFDWNQKQDHNPSLFMSDVKNM